MKLNKKMLIIASVSVSVLLIAAVSAEGVSFTGFFKAFDRTVYPGGEYEKNLTVRKYYNSTVRFRKAGSTTYLGFEDSDSVMVFKDSNGIELFRLTGVSEGKAYEILNNSVLSSIAKVSVYGLDGYKDVADQYPLVSTTGTKAYITIDLEEASVPVKVGGYVIDDLTKTPVGDLEISAFENGADVETSDSLGAAISNTEGYYEMSFEFDEKQSLSFYVKDFYVVA